LQQVTCRQKAASEPAIAFLGRRRRLYSVHQEHGRHVIRKTASFLAESCQKAARKLPESASQLTILLGTPPACRQQTDGKPPES